ncbi:hypothetical protein [Paraburkholderia xenovorans]
MNRERGNWNPFKLLRRFARGSVPSPAALATDDPQGSQGAPNQPQCLQGNPLRAMNEWFQEPFFGELDRWFDDVSTSRFEAHVDETKDSESIRVAAGQPGMPRKTFPFVSHGKHWPSGA